MTIDRNNWLRPFTHFNVLPFPCPKCKVGLLTIKKAEKDGGVNLVVEAETAASAWRSSRPGWTPFDEDGLFGMILVCHCRTVVRS